MRKRPAKSIEKTAFVNLSVVFFGFGAILEYLSIRGFFSTLDWLLRQALLAVRRFLVKNRRCENNAVNCQD